MRLPGLLFETEEFTIFFGNGNVSADEIATYFSAFEFRSLNQTHSDVAVQSTRDKPSADAHFTNEPNMALMIRTADCLPVFIANPNFGVAAIHAGWRGIENDIIRKTLSVYGPPPGGFAVIGPHIREPSFEVSTDIAEKLTQTYRRAGGARIPKLLDHPDPKKRFVDLSLIARQQLRQSDLTSVVVVECNTFTSAHLESFRRDGENSGRNWSFIARKARRA